MPPANQLIFDLMQHLRILSPDECHKIGVRYNEAGGTQTLIEFLIGGGYLGLGHIGRLAAMERSSGGDLAPDEREALRYLRGELVAHQERLGSPSAQATHHDTPRAGTQREGRSDTEREND